VRRWTAAALVTGAAFVPLFEGVVHPREYALGHERQQLAAVAADVTRWQIAHAGLFVVIVLTVAAAVGLALMLAPAMPRLAAWCGALAVIGAMSFAATDALDGFTWGVLGEVAGRPGTDPRTIEAALHAVQNDGWGLLYGLPAFALTTALALLAYGLVRAGDVPARAGWAFGIGLVAIAINPVFHTTGWYLVSGLIYLAGSLALAAALVRPASSPSPLPAT